MDSPPKRLKIKLKQLFNTTSDRRKKMSISKKLIIGAAAIAVAGGVEIGRAHV